MVLQLSSSGLSIQTTTELFDELAALLIAQFGNSLNTTIQSVSGQFMSIMSELRSIDQQTLLDVYRSFDPNSAEGRALDRLAALTGSVRLGATNSTVEGLIEFSAAGTVNDGDLILNDDQNSTWQAINGPYSDTGGPYPEFIAAQYQAVNTGPLLANANTNWSIVTVSAGVAAFVNPVEDATVGRNQESDPDFRARRILELFSPGQGPLTTINSIVSKVNTDNGQVDFVRTYHNPNENPTGTQPNNLNIPFKAFNVVVETTPSPPPAGLQQDIWDAILTATGAGGFAYGTDYSGTAVDNEGQTHSVSFDLVQEIDVYMLVSVVTTLSDDTPTIPEDPLQMATVIQTACVNAFNTSFRIIGRDVREIDYIGAIQNLILSGQLSGIDSIDVDLSLVSKVGPYTPTLLPITIRQKADLDTGEVAVNVNGTLEIF